MSYPRTINIKEFEAQLRQYTGTTTSDYVMGLFVREEDL